jgi:hypothetical protein
MQTDLFRPFTEKLRRALDRDMPGALIYAYVIGLTLAYTFVMVHTPLTLHLHLIHDDAWYMAQGQSLAMGKWLGPFTQYTLMKGPGYAAFLALSHWLGVSVSLAHALFHCAAITLFVVVAHRFVRSLVLSGLLLAMLLWHPISMTAFTLRVFRDEIYHGQIFLLLAALLYVLFYPIANRQRNIFAALVGLVFGWFWLTREEGLWIIPAIVLLLAVAGSRAFREQRIRAFAGILLVVFGVFAAVQIGFRSINWRVYGSFIGVDVNEPNFQRALGAIHSVRSGEVRPFVSITRAARERVYAVSPAFSSLSGYFDGTPDVGWAKKVTCNVSPSICGEIGSGWFMWALRDAAAAGGHYQSPAKAAAFFRQIADEISAACARGDLQCSHQLIPAMPPISWRQIVDRLPSRLLRAYTLLTPPTWPLQFQLGTGDRQRIEASLRFLNYPRHTASSDVPPQQATYALVGWYYKSGGEWLSMKVLGADGSPTEFRVDRNPSADLQRAFKDPLASNQRFRIATRCDDRCVVQFHAPDGEKTDKQLAELRQTPLAFNLGRGRVHLDYTEVHTDLKSIRFRSEDVSNGIRVAIVTHYNLIFFPLLVLGLAAFLAATLLRWKKVMANTCYILALVAWTLVIMRTALLVLIDVTSFPALSAAHYLAPAYFFLVCASVFSCVTCLQLFFQAPGDQAALAGADQKTSLTTP